MSVQSAHGSALALQLVPPTPKAAPGCWVHWSGCSVCGSVGQDTVNGRGFMEIPVGICTQSILLPRTPTSCEDAAANEGWQGRGLSLPAWEFLLCRERLMLLWASSQRLFHFQSIRGDRADEEPVCHRGPQGENLHPSLCSHTTSAHTCQDKGAALGAGSQLDHSWITACQPCQPLPHTPLLALLWDKPFPKCLVLQINPWPSFSEQIQRFVL